MLSKTGLPSPPLRSASCDPAPYLSDDAEIPAAICDWTGKTYEQLLEKIAIKALLAKAAQHEAATLFSSESSSRSSKSTRSRSPSLKQSSIDKFFTKVKETESKAVSDAGMYCKEKQARDVGLIDSCADAHGLLSDSSILPKPSPIYIDVPPCTDCEALRRQLVDLKAKHAILAFKIEELEQDKGELEAIGEDDSFGEGTMDDNLSSVFSDRHLVTKNLEEKPIWSDTDECTMDDNLSSVWTDEHMVINLEEENITEAEERTAFDEVTSDDAQTPTPSAGRSIFNRLTIGSDGKPEREVLEEGILYKIEEDVEGEEDEGVEEDTNEGETADDDEENGPSETESSNVTSALLQISEAVLSGCSTTLLKQETSGDNDEDSPPDTNNDELDAEGNLGATPPTVQPLALNTSSGGCITAEPELDLSEHAEFMKGAEPGDVAATEPSPRKVAPSTFHDASSRDNNHSSSVSPTRDAHPITTEAPDLKPTSTDSSLQKPSGKASDNANSPRPVRAPRHYEFKGKCYHCNESGHKSFDCPGRKAIAGQANGVQSEYPRPSRFVQDVRLEDSAFPTTRVVKDVRLENTAPATQVKRVQPGRAPSNHQKRNFRQRGGPSTKPAPLRKTRTASNTATAIKSGLSEDIIEKASGWQAFSQAAALAPYSADPFNAGKQGEKTSFAEGNAPDVVWGNDTFSKRGANGKVVERTAY
ncbi:hypothetical protein BU16DRAFT_601034 [Lophium mytilinum]|uniref:CCHC-type domain-containing protein n=1 Tax=Lophium mytilinum TaxID=390894 RepID=A0A6A6Q9M2_9PEZI|nr:hypothetical protein BU16DRAFT_601034 [Lophium mytilinum]